METINPDDVKVSRTYAVREMVPQYRKARVVRMEEATDAPGQIRCTLVPEGAGQGETLSCMAGDLYPESAVPSAGLTAQADKHVLLLASLCAGLLEDDFCVDCIENYIAGLPGMSEEKASEVVRELMEAHQAMQAEAALLNLKPVVAQRTQVTLSVEVKDAILEQIKSEEVVKNGDVVERAICDADITDDVVNTETMAKLMSYSSTTLRSVPGIPVYGRHPKKGRFYRPSEVIKFMKEHDHMSAARLEKLGIVTEDNWREVLDTAVELTPDSSVSINYLAWLMEYDVPTVEKYLMDPSGVWRGCCVSRSDGGVLVILKGVLQWMTRYRGAKYARITEFFPKLALVK